MLVTKTLNSSVGSDDTILYQKVNVDASQNLEGGTDSSGTEENLFDV